MTPSSPKNTTNIRNTPHATKNNVGNYRHLHLGNYNRNVPQPPTNIKNRKAYIMGSGIAGLTAAFYLIRDGHMPAKNITILESLDVLGGALDGASNATQGYIARGGREMESYYENFWDVFQDIPALELPEGYSVLDEFHLANDHDPNFSKARLLQNQGELKDFSTFELSKSQQLEIIKLLLAKKETLEDVTVEQYFSEGFLQSNFWTFWRTMFAFENWQSVLETKLYMHRFLHCIDGLNDMSSLVFSKYNQYDSFVRPIADWLKQQGVVFAYGTTVVDANITLSDDEKTITGLMVEKKHANTATQETIAIAPDDVVLLTLGSITENTGYGDDHTVAPIIRDQTSSCWSLWKNLAKKSPEFGNPHKFCDDIDKSMWESATLTCRPSPLLDKLAELSINPPTSGKTVTGGIITFTDSNWLMSFTCNRQPHFPNQPKDVVVIWAYALLMDKTGNYVKKTMPDCTGQEILQEMCYHLGIIDEYENIKDQTIVRTAMMPYITAQFMPRKLGDRPLVVPNGSRNFGLLGQFVETDNDVVFTVESSVRTARLAVYTLLDLDKQIPDIAPTQYDIREVLKAARTLNNNQPFVGEAILNRILENTYFADILPKNMQVDGKKLSERFKENKDIVQQNHEQDSKIMGLFDMLKSHLPF